MANLSHAFRENALNAYRKDICNLDSKSSETPRKTTERCQTHSSQSSSFHGNQHSASRTPLKSPHPTGGSSSTSSPHHNKQGGTKQIQAVDPYLAALTKETRGKTKQRYSSTDYLMQW